jgi:glyoxylase-like metal-dependent hydrolase (beta-lactamase superfamily II)
MQVHHLNCGTISVWGGVAIIGTGGLFKPAHGVIHCILAETDDGLLLIDTGFGTRDFIAPTPLNNWFITLSGSPRDQRETAVDQVRRLGYAPEDVRHIAVTHFHFDHVGGLPTSHRPAYTFSTRSWRACCIRAICMSGTSTAPNIGRITPAG